MAVYRRSNRHRFLLLLLILTSVTVITLDERAARAGFLGSLRSGVRDVFSPVGRTADRVVSPVGDFLSGTVRYGDLQDENARLRREVDDARARGLQSADTERELRQLKENERLPFAEAIPAVSARVVASTPSNFQLTVEVDKGTADGLARDMPVVTGAGLVGRVGEVSKNRAVVLLVTDRTFKVGVRLSASGDVAVAKGAGEGEALTVDLVENTTAVMPGEVVVTSGLSGSPFPPGIPVAKVRSARPDTSAKQQDIALDPVVDLNRIEFVKILRWEP